MMRMSRIVVLSILAILLTGVIAFSANVRKAEATGTIYIRTDGSIDPPAARIFTVDNGTYTFTDDIYDQIVVERSNIIIDGNGYALQGSGGGNGFYGNGISNVTMKNTKITGFEYGIYLNLTSDIAILSNNVTNNWWGILLFESSNASIYGNNITEHVRQGIVLYISSNNRIFRNNITDNGWGNMQGIWLYIAFNNSIGGNIITRNDNGIGLGSSSSNSIIGNNIVANDENGVQLINSTENLIYHNNLSQNKNQAYIENSANLWDDGYPSGGNYWSDYNGTDSSADGIGDTPYVIDANNTDNYPLITQIGLPVNTLWDPSRDSYSQNNYASAWSRETAMV